ncbi:MAG: carboxypeptidase-like regulatory domain-containing protein [Candidatus Dojkabacteria bacterium]
MGRENDEAETGLDKDKLKEIRKITLRSNILIAMLVLAIAVFIGGASVAAILIARGENRSDSGLSQTGSIRINTEINRLQIKLDGEFISKANDDLIPNLEPGTYELEVTSPNYSIWQKSVEVRRGLVTDVFPQLIPEEITPEIFSSLPVSQTTFDYKGEYMYYVVSEAARGRDNGIWRQRISESSGFDFFGRNEPVKLANIGNEIASSLDEGNLRLLPSPDNSRLLLQLGERYHLLDATRTNDMSEKEPLSLSINVPFDSLSWGVDDENLIVVNQNILSSYNINEDTLSLIGISEPGTDPVYAVSETIIYYYNANLDQLEAFSENGSVLVEFVNGEINLPISALHTSREDNNLLYYKSEAQFYFADLDSSYQIELEEMVSLEQVSNTGLGALGKDKNGNFIVIRMSELPALRTYNKQINLIDLPQPEDVVRQIRFSSLGRHLLIKDELGSLYIADRNGENLRIIDETEGVINGSFATNESDLRIFAVINGNALQDDVTQNLIYEIPLRDQ